MYEILYDNYGLIRSGQKSARICCIVPWVKLIKTKMLRYFLRAVYQNKNNFYHTLYGLSIF